VQILLLWKWQVQMDSDSTQSEQTKAFSYDILDEEARKISELVATVQKKYAEVPLAELPLTIFQMGDEYHAQGHSAQAEFLYLHAVSLWEREFKLEYPYEFRGLKAYAQALYERHMATHARVVGLGDLDQAA
jgi:hypothetical protein